MTENYKPSQTPDAAPQDQSENSKKEYSKPIVKRHGNVRNISQLS